jgi:hypothetical protein
MRTWKLKIGVIAILAILICMRVRQANEPVTLKPVLMKLHGNFSTAEVAGWQDLNDDVGPEYVAFNTQNGGSEVMRFLDRGLKAEDTKFAKLKSQKPVARIEYLKWDTMLYLFEDGTLDGPENILRTIKNMGVGKVYDMLCQAGLRPKLLLLTERGPLLLNLSEGLEMKDAKFLTNRIAKGDTLRVLEHGRWELGTPVLAASGRKVYKLMNEKDSYHWNMVSEIPANMGLNKLGEFQLKRSITCIEHGGGSEFVVHRWCGCSVL